VTSRASPIVLLLLAACSATSPRSSSSTFRSPRPATLHPVVQVGEGPIGAFELSVDGKLFATTAAEGRTLEIRDAVRLGIVAELDVGAVVTDVWWSADGKYLLAGGRDVLAAWDATTGAPLANVPQPSAFVPMGEAIASLSVVNQKVTVTSLTRKTTHAFSVAATALDPRPAGARIALAVAKDVELRELDGRVVSRLPNVEASTSDGAFVYARPEIFDARTGAVAVELATTRSRRGRFAPTGHHFVYLGDSSLRAVTPPEADRRASDVVLAANVHEFDISPDGTRVVYTDAEGSVLVVPFEGGTPTPFAAKRASPNPSVAFGPTGREILVGDSPVVIYDAQSQESLGEIPASNGCSVSWFAEGGPRAACPLGTGVFSLFRPRGQGISRFFVHREPVGSIQFHEVDRALEVQCLNGQSMRVALGGGSTSDVESRPDPQPKTRGRPDDAVGTNLFARIQSGELEVGELATRRTRLRRSFAREIGAVSIDASEKMIAVATDDRILLLDAATGETQKELVVPVIEANSTRRRRWLAPIHALSFRSNSRFLVASRRQLDKPVPLSRGREDAESSDRIRVWDVDTGKLVVELVGDAAAWTPDGTKLVSRNRDIEIRDAAEFTETGKIALEASTPERFKTRSLGRNRGAAMVVTTATVTGVGADGVELDPTAPPSRSVIVAIANRVLAVADPQGESPVGFDLSLHELPSGRRIGRVSAPFPVDSSALWQDGSFLAFATRDLVRIHRLADQREIWIAPTVDESDRCRLAAFDDAGRFDGEIRGLLAFRRGDELRGELVTRGALLEPFHTPNLLRKFFAGR
jgi:WD40 repeat protein